MLVKENEITVGTGNLGVCCLWKRRDKVEIPESYYKILGNLYSTRGIGYLITNCLRQGIKYIYILDTPDTTRTKHKLMFGDYTPKEIGLPEYYVTLFKNQTYIYDLNILREERDYLDTYYLSQSYLENDYDAIKYLTTTINFKIKPIDCPEPEEGEIGETKPGSKTAVHLHGENLYDLHRQIVRQVYYHGAVTDSDKEGNYRKEIVGITATIKPKAEPKDALSSPHIDMVTLLEYCNELFEGSRENGDTTYTYGDTIRNKYGDQYQQVVSAMRKKLSTYRAYIPLWEPGKTILEDDAPCLVSLQPKYSNGKLYLFAHFRTHDMYKGWLLNAAGLVFWHKRLCEELIVERGDLMILSGSAHIYSQDSADIIEYIKGTPDKVILEEVHFTFERSVMGFKAHIFENGSYKGVEEHRTAQGLIRKLKPYINTVQHALYVGNEIGKLDWGE